MSEKTASLSALYDRLLESEIPGKTYSATNSAQSLLDLLFSSPVDSRPQPGGDPAFVQDVKRSNLRTYGVYFAELVADLETGVLKRLTEFEITEDKSVHGIDELIDTVN